MMPEQRFGSGPFTFRINDNGSGPQLLTQVCLERGWREYNPDYNENWNLWWRTSGFPISHHKCLTSFQYLNHIPKGSMICRKDNLIRYLRCMKKVYGTIYDFSPDSYNLPLEYTKLVSECSHSKFQTRKEDKLRACVADNRIWISKPVAQSQGRGIFLFRKLSELNYDTSTIVQRYIENPLLIGGYKFDLRLYVCVPSYHPVTIYMYTEGLARFGTDKFSLNDLKNPFRHLTNSSINKLGPGYLEMKERVGSGCKWTLRQLRRYLRQTGIFDWLIWQKVTSLVILTVLSHIQQIPSTTNCFEFFGFDILIDNALRPWLLEVNLSPALSNDCDADRLVKKSMLHDMFDLLGFPMLNTGLSVFTVWLEESDQNDDFVKNDQTVKNQQTLINAESKRRQKYRISSARSKVSARARRRTTSASNKRGYLKLPKVQVDGAALEANYHDVPKGKLVAENFANSSRKIWGNGKDWSCPIPREGGWVRIWPMTLDHGDENGNPIVSGGIKNVVNAVVKFNKVAKELMKKHPAASECQLNEFLQQEINMAVDVWMPPS
ncbi:probable tubulin polyglutamylase TTLL2 [Cylas formicarius]|uniref:probable tubulin polyglutamylase TTLL2 n=1 Tax=Cylas formicarius TaxID=197179 RepID=UPI002958DA25|nr:probable tubulin polyglutamylase TTLL2 [Cylas formicarius]XP_060518782.1 probable tubulin polyglutamylase TTLL2 [Cylas formicarius]